jgi:hypothetical protein
VRLDPADFAPAAPMASAMMAGLFAFDAGEPLDSNPHGPGIERDAWEEGWIDAETQSLQWAADKAAGKAECPVCHDTGYQIVEPFNPYARTYVTVCSECQR